MAAIPQRLKTRKDSDLDPQHRSGSPNEMALEHALGFDDDRAEIPVFCAGGCGEIMGFLKKGQSIPTVRCSACQAAEMAKASLSSTEAMPANTDELAELRSPPRDLRKIHIVQVVAVALIFAGSLFIAMGRPLGIYLAAFGILAWIGAALVLWRLRN